MAVSKRLRYEILRRDNHTCRYCGATAPDVRLTVDHVTPTALGGSDDSTNLVTACIDCNFGKTSSSPGAPLVADVTQDALRWSRAIQEAARIQERHREDRERIFAWFAEQWDQWHYGYRELPVPRPANWRHSVENFLASESTTQEMEYALRAAMTSSAGPETTWRYFCGVMWRLIKERQEIARSLLTVEEEDTQD